MLKASEKLKPRLKFKKAREGKPPGSWRTAEHTFSPTESWGAGLVTLYPAGFQLGHTVRGVVLISVSCLTT